MLPSNSAGDRSVSLWFENLTTERSDSEWEARSSRFRSHNQTTSYKVSVWGLYSLSSFRAHLWIQATPSPRHTHTQNTTLATRAVASRCLVSHRRHAKSERLLYELPTLFCPIFNAVTVYPHYILMLGGAAGVLRRQGVCFNLGNVCMLPVRWCLWGERYSQ